MCINRQIRSGGGQRSSSSRRRFRNISNDRTKKERNSNMAKNQTQKNISDTRRDRSKSNDYQKYIGNQLKRTRVVCVWVF